MIARKEKPGFLTSDCCFQPDKCLFLRQIRSDRLGLVNDCRHAARADMQFTVVITQNDERKLRIFTFAIEALFCCFHWTSRNNGLRIQFDKIFQRAKIGNSLVKCNGRKRLNILSFLVYHQFKTILFHARPKRKDGRFV